MGVCEQRNSTTIAVGTAVRETVMQALSAAGVAYLGPSDGKLTNKTVKTAWLTGAVALITPQHQGRQARRVAHS